MRHKAFKFKIEPNKRQKVLIDKTLGCCRFLYNQMLNERLEKYKNDDKSKPKTEKEYKIEFNWLKEVDSISLQQSTNDLILAYKNFFRKIKQKQKTSLQFKSRKNPKNSYRTINGNNGTSIRIKGNRIRLPKLGFVRFKKSREIAGEIKSVTVSKNILGKYYISILCKTEIKELPKLNTKIGIDLGIKDYAITSNGIKHSNPKYLRVLEHKLSKAQRKLRRKEKGSKRRLKQQKHIFKIYQKISNLRNDFLHKLSTKLVNENQIICLEDLNVKGMLKNHKLAKSISDASWSRFVELLKYKSDWYGRELIQIGRFFPSSKTCNNCGNKNTKLELKDRSWTCCECGSVLDRDFNASLNILDEGLRILNKNRRDGEVSSLNNKTLSLCS